MGKTVSVMLVFLGGIETQEGQLAMREMTMSGELLLVMSSHMKVGESIGHGGLQRNMRAGLRDKDEEDSDVQTSVGRNEGDWVPVDCGDPDWRCRTDAVVSTVQNGGGEEKEEEEVPLDGEGQDEGKEGMIGDYDGDTDRKAMTRLNRTKTIAGDGRLVWGPLSRG